MASLEKSEINENTLQLPATSPCASSAATSVTSGPDSVGISPSSSTDFPPDPLDHTSPEYEVINAPTSFPEEEDMASKIKQQSAHLHRSHSLSSSSVSSGGWTSSYGPSNVMSRSSSFPTQLSLIDFPKVDPNVVTDLESHANRLADKLYHMMALLKNSLYKMSGLSLACTEAFSDSVNYTCDSVDSCIKVMYTLMAKCEEISNEANAALNLQHDIQEIKRVLDKIEPVLLYGASA